MIDAIIALIGGLGAFLIGFKILSENIEIRGKIQSVEQLFLQMFVNSIKPLIKILFP